MASNVEGPRYFLPSEIARLVLGFLKEEKYSKTFKCFIKECEDLKEVEKFLQQGLQYPLTILGLSLTAILQDYGRMKLEGMQTSQGPLHISALWKQLDSVVTHLKTRTADPRSRNMRGADGEKQATRTKRLTSRVLGQVSRFTATTGCISAANETTVGESGDSASDDAGLPLTCSIPRVPETGSAVQHPAITSELNEPRVIIATPIGMAKSELTGGRADLRKKSEPKTVAGKRDSSAASARPRCQSKFGVSVLGEGSPVNCETSDATPARGSCETSAPITELTLPENQSEVSGSSGPPTSRLTKEASCVKSTVHLSSGQLFQPSDFSAPFPIINTTPSKGNPTACIMHTDDESSSSSQTLHIIDRSRPLYSPAKSANVTSVVETVKTVPSVTSHMPVAVTQDSGEPSTGSDQRGPIASRQPVQCDNGMEPIHATDSKKQKDTDVSLPLLAEGQGEDECVSGTDRLDGNQGDVTASRTDHDTDAAFLVPDEQRVLHPRPVTPIAPKSPKRKKKTPRKRHSDVQPLGNGADRPGTSRQDKNPLEKIISDGKIAKNLAAVINKTLLSDGQLQQKSVAAVTVASRVSVSDAIGAVDAVSTDSVLDEFLSTGHQNMSEDTVSNIIKMTRNDPVFDSLFEIFNADREEYIQREFGKSHSKDTTEPGGQETGTPPNTPQAELNTPPHSVDSTADFAQHSSAEPQPHASLVVGLIQPSSNTFHGCGSEGDLVESETTCRVTSMSSSRPSNKLMESCSAIANSDLSEEEHFAASSSCSVKICNLNPVSTQELSRESACRPISESASLSSESTLLYGNIVMYGAPETFTEGGQKADKVQALASVQKKGGGGGLRFEHRTGDGDCLFVRDKDNPPLGSSVLQSQAVSIAESEIQPEKFACTHRPVSGGDIQARPGLSGNVCEEENSNHSAVSASQSAGITGKHVPADDVSHEKCMPDQEGLMSSPGTSVPIRREKSDEVSILVHLKRAISKDLNDLSRSCHSTSASPLRNQGGNSNNCTPQRRRGVDSTPCSSGHRQGTGSAHSTPQRRHEVDFTQCTPLRRYSSAQCTPQQKRGTDFTHCTPRRRHDIDSAHSTPRQRHRVDSVYCTPQSRLEWESAHSTPQHALELNPGSGYITPHSGSRCSDNLSNHSVSQHVAANITGVNGIAGLNERLQELSQLSCRSVHSSSGLDIIQDDVDAAVSEGSRKSVSQHSFHTVEEATGSKVEDRLHELSHQSASCRSTRSTPQHSRSDGTHSSSSSPKRCGNFAGETGSGSHLAYFHEEKLSLQLGKLPVRVQTTGTNISHENISQHSSHHLVADLQNNTCAGTVSCEVLGQSLPDPQQQQLSENGTNVASDASICKTVKPGEQSHKPVRFAQDGTGPGDMFISPTIGDDVCKTNISFPVLPTDVREALASQLASGELQLPHDWGTMTVTPQKLQNIPQQDTSPLQQVPGVTQTALDKSSSPKKQSLPTRNLFSSVNTEIGQFAALSTPKNPQKKSEECLITASASGEQKAPKVSSAKGKSDKTKASSLKTSSLQKLLQNSNVPVKKAQAAHLVAVAKSVLPKKSPKSICTRSVSRQLRSRKANPKSPPHLAAIKSVSKKTLKVVLERICTKTVPNCGRLGTGIHKADKSAPDLSVNKSTRGENLGTEESQPLTTRSPIKDAVEKSPAAKESLHGKSGKQSPVKSFPATVASQASAFQSHIQSCSFTPTQQPVTAGIRPHGPYRRIKPITLSRTVSSSMFSNSCASHGGSSFQLFPIGPSHSPAPLACPESPAAALLSPMPVSVDTASPAAVGPTDERTFSPPVPSATSHIPDSSDPFVTPLSPGLRKSVSSKVSVSLPVKTSAETLVSSQANSEPSVKTIKSPVSAQGKIREANSKLSSKRGSSKHAQSVKKYKSKKDLVYHSKRNLSGSTKSEAKTSRGSEKTCQALVGKMTLDVKGKPPTKRRKAEGPERNGIYCQNLTSDGSETNQAVRVLEGILATGNTCLDSQVNRRSQVGDLCSEDEDVDVVNVSGELEHDELPDLTPAPITSRSFHSTSNELASRDLTVETVATRSFQEHSPTKDDNHCRDSSSQKGAVSDLSAEPITPGFLSMPVIDGSVPSPAKNGSSVHSSGDDSQLFNVLSIEDTMSGPAVHLVQGKDLPAESRAAATSTDDEVSSFETFQELLTRAGVSLTPSKPNPEAIVTPASKHRDWGNEGLSIGTPPHVSSASGSGGRRGSQVQMLSATGTGGHAVESSPVGSVNKVAGGEGCVEEFLGEGYFISRREADHGNTIVADPGVLKNVRAKRYEPMPASVGDSEQGLLSVSTSGSNHPTPSQSILSAKADSSGQAETSLSLGHKPLIRSTSSQDTPMLGLTVPLGEVVEQLQQRGLFQAGMSHLTGHGGTFRQILPKPLPSTSDINPISSTGKSSKRKGKSKAVPEKSRTSVQDLKAAPVGVNLDAEAAPLEIVKSGIQDTISDAKNETALRTEDPSSAKTANSNVSGQGDQGDQRGNFQTHCPVGPSMPDLSFLSPLKMASYTSPRTVHGISAVPASPGMPPPQAATRVVDEEVSLSNHGSLVTLKAASLTPPTPVSNVSRRLNVTASVNSAVIKASTAAEISSLLCDADSTPVIPVNRVTRRPSVCMPSSPATMMAAETLASIATSGGRETEGESGEKSRKSTSQTASSRKRRRTGEKDAQSAASQPQNKQCPYCSKQFQKPSDCQRHVRTHTGEKPFKCYVCDKSFGDKSTMGKHIMRHHEFNKSKKKQEVQSESKAYQCPRCGVSCRNSPQLHWHMAKHDSEDTPKKRARHRRNTSNRDSNHQSLHQSEWQAENAARTSDVARGSKEAQLTEPETAVDHDAHLLRNIDVDKLIRKIHRH